MKLSFADWLFGFIVIALYLIAWFTLRRWRKDIVYIGYIGLCTAGFFWRVLFAGAFIPAGGGDISAIIYPVYHFAQENFRQGIIPLWNPHLYAGIPFVGHIQSGPFYPPNLLLFLLTPEVTYRSILYLLSAHFWLAGVLMYFMLRSLDGRPMTDDGRPMADDTKLPSRVTRHPSSISRPAALLGALVFMFNDFFITHTGNPNMVAVGAWLPLVFLLFRHALTHSHIFYALLAGAVTGMAYLAGHIQPFLYILFVVGAYAVYVTLFELKKESSKKKDLSFFLLLSAFARPVIYLLAFLAFTIFVSAISLVPNVEMSTQSLRDSLTYSDAARYMLPPAHLIGLLSPELWGRGPEIHWGPWERVEVGYVGVLPLILAVLGLMWRKGREPRFFVLLGLIAFMLALGFYTVLHGWLYLIPGYSQIRVPARFVFLLDFAIAALAAYGFETLRQPLPRLFHAAWRKLFPVLSIALAATLFVFVPLMFVAVVLNQTQDSAIFNRTANGFNGLILFALWLGASLVLLLARRTRWLTMPMWTLAMIGLAFADLSSAGSYLDLGERDPTMNFHHPAVFNFLRRDPNPFRIETPEESWFEWQPNLGLLARLDDAAGIYNPLLLQRYDRYWKAAIGRENVLYDLLNTKYLIAKKDAKVSAKFTPVFAGDPTVNVYLNPKALPRAFMVPQAHVVANADEALAAIQAKDFDPTKTIILENSQLPTSKSQLPITNYQSSVSLKSRSTNTLEFDVTTNGDGFLFVGDTFYPGWRATVDDNDTPVLRANYLFRAVAVPAGTHTVRMIFDPWSFKVGVGMTVVGILGVCAGWWFTRKR
jgi:hypothetical protein